MPELPEVEHAAGVLRRATAGRQLAGLRLLHPSLRRRVRPRLLAAIAGASVAGVERLGKHQLLRLEGGAVVHVHFRMAGDWVVVPTDDPLPPHARAVLELDDASRVVLVDPRMLSTIDVHLDGRPSLPPLGPDPTDESLDAAALRALLRTRRGPIKPVLLDQRVIAGLGNIYAAEALWIAKISPRASASTLSPARVQRLLAGMREALSRGSAEPGRYADGAGETLRVYGREGERCVRCGATIRRMVQAGRSTYYCPVCQRR